MLVLCAFALACGEAGGPSNGLNGTSTMKLELPQSDIIEKVDYTIRVTFLETVPPTPTLQEEQSSVFRNGELVTILPCTTGPDGTGLNQMDVTAKIFVRGVESPYDASGSAVFTCVRNADTPINIVLNVILPRDGGFVDPDFMVGGTLCSSKIDEKDDGFLGVCAESKCGGGGAVMVFANECEAVQAQTPTYWLCGDPADWRVTGKVANAFFPIPQHNGTWRFGVIALDVFQMRQEDPSLTGPDGTVRVWAGLSATRALLERQNGATVRRENAPFEYEFAAELAVAPREAGQPSPEALLLVDQDSVYGARVTWQRRFGACDVPTEGITLYPGVKAIDLRRDGNQAARITLGDIVTGYAVSTARCETGWDDSGAAPRPIITCGAPTPILP